LLAHPCRIAFNLIALPSTWNPISYLGDQFSEDTAKINTAFDNSLDFPRFHHSKQSPSRPVQARASCALRIKEENYTHIPEKVLIVLILLIVIAWRM